MPEDAPPAEEPDARGPVQRVVRTVGPWALAAALLVWIASRVSFGEAWEAARQSNLVAFGAALSVAVVYWFLLESRAFAYLFTRFNAPLSWGEARSLRGMTYLLTPINWNAGTAGILVYLNRAKGVSALESGSSMMLYGAVDGLVLITLLGAGMLLHPAAGGFADLVPWIAGFLGLQFVFLALVMRDRPTWRWLEIVRRSRLMQSARKARLRDLAVLFGVRSAYFLGFVGLFGWGARAFDVELPVGVVAMTMPVVLGSAMFTPAGMGGQQAAMLEVWSGFGEEASILAFAVAFPVGLIAVRMLVGLFYLRDLAEFRRLRDDVEESDG